MKLTIHGVGAHHPGETLDQVVGWNIPNAETGEWREFNWNQYVEQADEVTLNYDQIKQIIHAVAAAGRLLFSPAVEQSVIDQEPSAPTRFLADWSEAILTACLLLALLVPPFVLLMQFMQSVFSYSIGSPDKILLMLKLTGAVAVGCVVATPVVSVLSALRRRRAYPIPVGLCWSILLIARPVIYLCLIPFTPRMRRILFVDGNTFKLVLFGGFGIVLGVLQAPFAGLTRAEALSPGWFSILALAAACIAWLAGMITQLLLGPSLKVLLDIFRYIGEPGYRDTLQKELDEVLDSSQDASIIIVAHSLGSVIAVDSLLNSGVWNNRHSVVLITMGSPLRRFFFRFFPGLLFPPSACQIGRNISSRIGNFRWINVYRPFDQIGASLGLSREDAGKDVRVPRWTRVLRAHTGYFSDPAVRAATNASLAKSETFKGSALPAELKTWWLPNFRRMPLATRCVLEVGELATFLIPVLLCMWNLVTIPHIKTSAVAALEETRRRVEQSGTLMLPHVEHWTEEFYVNTTSMADRIRVDIDHFRFLFNEGEMYSKEFSIETGYMFERYAYIFNIEALRQHIREDCELSRKPPLLRRTVTVPCRLRKSVRMRLLSFDPPTFDLPDFPPRSGAHMGWWTLAFWSAWSTAALAIVGFFVTRLGVHVARVFAG